MPESAAGGDAEIIHVAVAVIIDDAKVLISKRAKEAHQGGLWEFPGGKVEAGENCEEALVREIQEELGIHLMHSRPLIKVQHQYAATEKSPAVIVLLEVRLSKDFSGKDYTIEHKAQIGLEGQWVRWVNIEQLEHYPFPAANKAIINALCLADCYLITPDCCETDMEHFIQQFTENCSHYSLIQLRIKSLQGNKLQSLLKECSEIAERKGVSLLINSALMTLRKRIMSNNIGGMHLNSYHLMDNDFIENYRYQFPQRKISASCHNKEEIQRANQLKLDFIVISPVQSTRSHPGQKPLGWEKFKILCATAQMPAYALGGMSLSDIVLAQSNGAQGIAAISGLWSNNPGKRSCHLLQ